MKWTDPRTLEQGAIKACQAGAAVLRKFYESGLRARHKGDVNLLTQADLDSQKAIVRVLRRSFPTHLVLAEENSLGHDQTLSGPIWIIDPLDGTTNYAHGFPMFCVSMAYRERGVTRFGLVHHPLLDETFIAHRSKGAKLNGRRIHVSKTATLPFALLATGFPYDRRSSPANNLNLFCRFELKAQCVRRAGAAALDLAYVAAGRVDGFWEPKLAPWDIAAGALLVEEAGGKVTKYGGLTIDDLRCGEILASNGRIHAEMVEVIQETSQSVTLSEKGLLSLDQLRT